MNPAGPNETPRGPNYFYDDDEPPYQQTTGEPTGPPDSVTPPPSFAQFREGDYPDAAELPVPNVSPLTAHVLSCLREADFSGT
jgi:hypothetical protein